MNESSVSTPFMEKLRARLPGAVVLKLHDGSTIGIPDCCVTYRGRAFWFEFKLYRPLKSWDRVTVPVVDIAAESAVQMATAMALVHAGAYVRYIVWVKKQRMIDVWNPALAVRNYAQRFTTTPDVVEYIASEIERTCDSTASRG